MGTFSLCIIAQLLTRNQSYRPDARFLDPSPGLPGDRPWNWHKVEQRTLVTFSHCLYYNTKISLSPKENLCHFGLGSWVMFMNWAWVSGDSPSAHASPAFLSYCPIVRALITMFASLNFRDEGHLGESLSFSISCQWIYLFALFNGMFLLSNIRVKELSFQWQHKFMQKPRKKNS